MLLVDAAHRRVVPFVKEDRVRAIRLLSAGGGGVPAVNEWHTPSRVGTEVLPQGGDLVCGERWGQVIEIQILNLSALRPHQASASEGAV